jgi:hypothetical protein
VSGGKGNWVAKVWWIEIGKNDVEKAREKLARILGRFHTRKSL